MSDDEDEFEDEAYEDGTFGPDDEAEEPERDWHQEWKDDQMIPLREEPDDWDED